MLILFVELLFCVCADVAPCGREVEMQRALARREPERRPQGERRQQEDAVG
jgi:hypothetical protein